MKKMNVNKLGFSLGILFALMHLTWVLSVVIFGEKAAQYLAGLHFLTDIISTLPVTVGMTFLGLVLAFVSGYVIGSVFALIWNKLK